jgi:hypothetical protein
VELVAQIIAAAVPTHPGVGEADSAVVRVPYAPRLNEAGVQDDVNLIHLAPPEELDYLLLYDQLMTDLV